MLILITPLQFDDTKLLEQLSNSIKDIFEFPTKILPNEIELKEGWSFEREQLNSTWILSQLLKSFPQDNCKILGVTTLDLYTPILTFLFGEAELSGQAATFSNYRFYNEMYGLPSDNKLMNKRMIKEAIHELGHTFGLLHCQNYKCVMHASTYIEEFDFKSKYFCESCKETFTNNNIT